MKVFIVIQHLHDNRGAIYVYSTRTTLKAAEEDREKAQKDTLGGYLSWVEIAESEVQ